MTSTPQDISKEAIASLKAALTDVTLVEGGGQGGKGPLLRVVTVSSPHVTGCATAREPGEGTEGSGKKTSACSFALDVKGAWKATAAAAKKNNNDDNDNEKEIDGSYHVARIVNDPEFESGIGPLNVEMASDSSTTAAEGDAGAEAEAEAEAEAAALESARAEIAKRVVGAVKATLASASSSSSCPSSAAGKSKEQTKDVEGEKGTGAKAAGEAA